MTQSTLNITPPQNFPEKAELENILNRFPESAYTRLLLLYRSYQHGTENRLSFNDNSFLYFNNTRWVNFLIDDWMAQRQDVNSGHYAISIPEKDAPNHTTLPDAGVKEVQQSESINENIDEEPQPPLLNHDFKEAEMPQHASEEVEKLEVGATNESPALIEISDNALIFEPLHTTDYFASQGIKITEEPVSNDKLGKQLKSFTAWLKVMKKIHPSKLAIQNEGFDQLVQSEAERSNSDAEIITEAMAEVLVQQGKADKAVEIFEKLSLIYPAKSAYFAAKIESLKQQ